MIQTSAMTASANRCPICNKAAAPRAKNPTFPFCSARCKQVDLGKWLNEEYRVPGAAADTSDEAPPGDGDPKITH
jgi:endogenous inhibitor of DNA gyrase (YacG/DUF329 family)